MSIAIASLILLAVVAVVAVPVFGRVVGVATRRNENRPGGGDEDGSARGQPGDEEIHDEAEALKRTGPFFGGAAAVTGILMGLVGAVLATGIAGDASYLNTIPMTSLGAFLGIIGYVLGARRIGKSAIIFAMVAMVFGVAASQGYVPGVEPTDHGLPDEEPGAKAGATG
ncbi:MAG TPA: hypothetical protein VKA73_05265 [Rubrobacter sp.]|nr:hypothetical protein [Rubrobacter sp.]